jgi:hypothetical protein
VEAACTCAQTCALCVTLIEIVVVHDGRCVGLACVKPYTTDNARPRVAGTSIAWSGAAAAERSVLESLLALEVRRWPKRGNGSTATC